MTKPLRRGNANSYTPTHAHIAPAPTSWVRSCGKCHARFTSQLGSRRHPVFGLLCQGCTGGEKAT